MVTRVFVEKKKGFNIEAQHMLSDLKKNLRISGLEEVRILNRYDVAGLNEEQFQAAARTILSEPTMDSVYGEDYKLPEEYRVFAMEYLPGQYDQRIPGTLPEESTGYSLWNICPASMTSGRTQLPSACSCSPRVSAPQCFPLR